MSDACRVAVDAGTDAALALPTMVVVGIISVLAGKGDMKAGAALMILGQRIPTHNRQAKEAFRELEELIRSDI